MTNGGSPHKKSVKTEQSADKGVGDNNNQQKLNGDQATYVASAKEKPNEG